MRPVMGDWVGVTEDERVFEGVTEEDGVQERDNEPDDDAVTVGVMDGLGEGNRIGDVWLLEYGT
jgi:hypothetical protein